MKVSPGSPPHFSAKYKSPEFKKYLDEETQKYISENDLQSGYSDIQIIGHKETLENVLVDKGVKNKLSNICTQANTLYQQHNFTYKDDLVELPLAPPFLYRVFSNVVLTPDRSPKKYQSPLIKIINSALRKGKHSFYEQGGRFYCMGYSYSSDNTPLFPTGCSYQSLPSASDKVGTRGNIKIDGQGCVELDFVSMQPSILNVLAGIEEEYTDIYKIDEYSDEEWAVVRKDYKKCYACLLYASSEQKARSAIKLYKDKECTTLEFKALQIDQIISKIINQHPTWEKLGYFYSGTRGACYLQYLDSLICESILDKMITQGIVTLPVHDSFIIPDTKDNIRKLKTAMVKSLQEVLHTELAPTIKIE